jgi:hypothetical protein
MAPFFKRTSFKTSKFLSIIVLVLPGELIHLDLWLQALLHRGSLEEAVSPGSYELTEFPWSLQNSGYFIRAEGQPRVHLS